MWSGLRFEVRAPAAPPVPTRMDVACFVGFARRRDRTPSEAHQDWLRRAGWARLVRADALPVRPLPLPFESYEAFTAVFDAIVTDDEGRRWLAPLAGAVLDFFRQGGLRCYVLSVGDPPRSLPGFADTPRLLEQLVPGAGTAADALLATLEPGVTVASWDRSVVSPHDRDTWRGIGHLFGLGDAALLCLPDLPYLLGAPPPPAPAEPAPVVVTPQFIECAPSSFPVETVQLPRPPAAPRADATARQIWRATVHAAAVRLGLARPDVQLLFALPLATSGSRAETDPLDMLHREDLLAPLRDGGAGSARIQVAWPWVVGDTSAGRMGDLAPPDGLLAGLLAQNAMRAGTFRSASDLTPAGVTALSPKLGRLALHHERPIGNSSTPVRLADRVCLLGATPRGLRLLSDVTTSADPSWHQGGVSRLMDVVYREARRAGEALVFEASGPGTWRALVHAVDAALAGICEAGGFESRSSWRVRCDRTTMTQQDIDEGRLVCRIEVQPAPTIERITVVLNVLGGGVSLSAGRGEV